MSSESEDYVWNGICEEKLFTMRNVIAMLLKEDPSVARTIIEKEPLDTEEGKRCWKIVKDIFKKAHHTRRWVKDWPKSIDGVFDLATRYVECAIREDIEYEWGNQCNEFDRCSAEDHIATIASPKMYEKIDGRESAVHLMYHAYPFRRRGIETILNTAYEEALNEMKHDLTEILGQQIKRPKIDK